MALNLLYSQECPSILCFPPPPPKCWDSRHSQPQPVSGMLEIKLRVVRLLVMHSITRTTHPPSYSFLLFSFYFVDRILPHSSAGMEVTMQTRLPPDCGKRQHPAFYILPETGRGGKERRRKLEEREAAREGQVRSGIWECL